MHSIRLLQPSDSIQELTALLHRAYAALGAMGLNYTAVDQTPHVTRQRIDAGTCFVIEADGRIVGTAVVRHGYEKNQCAYYTRPHIAIINQLAVDPDHQGRGWGQALVQACETWALDRDCLETVIDTAIPARQLVRFYSSLGYEEVDQAQWPGKTYRSIIMRKWLPGTER